VVIENLNSVESRCLSKRRWGFSITVVCESLSEHLSSGRSLFFSPLLSEPRLVLTPLELLEPDGDASREGTVYDALHEVEGTGGEEDQGAAGEEQAEADLDDIFDRRGGAGDPDTGVGLGRFGFAQAAPPESRDVPDFRFAAGRRYRAIPTAVHEQVDLLE
jgi:hypothetical protein